MARRIALVAALIVSSAAPLAAQVRVGLSGFAGGYLPLNGLFDAVRVGGEQGEIVLNLGQEPGPLFGGRLAVRLHPQLAIDAEVAYAFSTLDIPVAADGSVDDSHVLLASLNARWIFFEAPFSPLSLHLTGGFGVVARNGEFWQNFDDTTTFAGTFSFGLRYGLTPLLFLRFDLKDYVYSFGPTAGNFTFTGKTQNDLLATLALEFALTPAR